MSSLLNFRVQDKVGHGLKVFKRLVCSLKDMAIRKLSPEELFKS